MKGNEIPHIGEVFNVMEKVCDIIAKSSPKTIYFPSHKAIASLIKMSVREYKISKQEAVSLMEKKQIIMNSDEYSKYIEWKKKYLKK